MKTAYHAEQHSVWFGIARFLFVLLLAAIFFLIGEEHVALIASIKVAGTTGTVPSDNSRHL